MVRRICGARARAEARKDGLYRNSGTATKQQRRAERAERLVVRETIRRQLTAGDISTSNLAA